MAATDVAPFIAVFIVGAVAGRLIAGRLAWVVALAFLVAHFLLSVGTGRAGDELFAYVVPVNIVLLVLAAFGAGVGRAARRSVM